MLKEVGASGLISLGKKYAGTTFYVIAHPGGGGHPFPSRQLELLGEILMLMDVDG